MNRTVMDIEAIELLVTRPWIDDEGLWVRTKLHGITDVDTARTVARDVMWELNRAWRGSERDDDGQLSARPRCSLRARPARGWQYQHGPEVAHAI